MPQTIEGQLSAAPYRFGIVVSRFNEFITRRLLDAGLDPATVLHTNDLVSGEDVFVSATGVTTGPMLNGVKFGKGMIETDTVVMRSVTGTVRRIIAEHRQLEKFHLD